MKEECGTAKAVKSEKRTKISCQVQKDFPNFKILPDFQNAIRNDNFKLVQIKSPDCTQPPDAHGNFPDLTFTEFYRINEAAPVPLLDEKDLALCSDNPDNPQKEACPNGLTTDQHDNYESLSSAITDLQKSESDCEGDGNEDKAVNGQDIQSWRLFSGIAKGQLSWSDFNIDGFTGRC